jgi:uncharacterized protein (TIGR03435 family)
MPTFEVVSVKPNRIGGPIQFSALSGGRLSATNVSVTQLIKAAYQVQDFQISGAPNWLDSDKYNIEAKSAGVANAEQTRLMLQSLLADRFKLTLHRETKEVPALALTLAKGSANKTTRLVQADNSGCQPEPSPSNPCDHIKGFPGGISGEKVSMPQLSLALGSMLRRTVVDQTGLDGVFDFKLDLALAGSAPTAGGNPSAPNDEMDGPSALVAGLQDQLGLKLERTKSQAAILVVDHVEKPSEN